MLMEQYRADRQFFAGKYYTIDPGNLSPLGSESIIQSRVIERENALETAVYVSDKFKKLPASYIPLYVEPSK